MLPPSLDPSSFVHRRSRIGLLGAHGRLGREIQSLLISPPWRAWWVCTASPRRGESFKALLKECDLILDVSSPEGFLELLRTFEKEGGSPPPCLVASTGWKPDALKQLEKWASQHPCLFAPNLSIGIALLAFCIESIQPVLTSFGFSCSLEETHHQFKKDSPSGTAQWLQKILSPQHPESIPCRSHREGNVIGIHTLTLDTATEQLTWTHTAKDRKLFAEGALRAASWFLKTRQKDPPLCPRLPPFFSMRDFLEAEFKNSFNQKGVS